MKDRPANGATFLHTGVLSVRGPEIGRRTGLEVKLYVPGEAVASPVVDRRASGYGLEPSLIRADVRPFLQRLDQVHEYIVGDFLGLAGA